MRGFHLLSIISIAIFTYGGCAPRNVITAEKYSVTKVDEADFVFPPDLSVANTAAQQFTSVPLGSLGGTHGPASASECKITGPWFSLERGVGTHTQWVARLPAPAAWNNEDLVAHSREYWTQFLESVAALETRGCLDARGYTRAISWLRESVPVPLVFSSLFSGPLDNRGFVNLESGMRITVERSVYRDASEHSPQNYLGETKAVYEVVRQPRDTLGLKFITFDKQPSISSHSVSDAFETKLAPRFQKLDGVRVFLLTLFVRPGVTRTALLIGVRDPSAMVEASREIDGSPEIPCNDLEATGAVCVSVEGDVSAFVELGIAVNGGRVFVPLTSTLQSVIGTLPQSEQASAWSTLHMRRRYRGQYYDVEFRTGDTELATMPIFPGDQLNWGTAAPSAR